MTDARIRFNIKAHNKIADKYEAHHTQIFNEIEQNRIRDHLTLALSLAQTTAASRTALDFGCGTGNMTAHLLKLGLGVTSADVAEGFLQIVAKKFPPSEKVHPLKLNGADLANIPSDSYDLTVAYAVLHHIPDYLGIVEELIRVTKPGGIIMIDREASADYWNKASAFQEFKNSLPFRPIKLPLSRFLKLDTYINRWKNMRNPRYQPEGDIHVWEDDHIEWDRIKTTFSRLGCEVVAEKEYLSFDSKYPMETYNRYKDRCTDDMLLLARKVPG